MRILHITDHYLPVLGGIETHVDALAQRQAARGDDVTVLTSTPPGNEERTGPVHVIRARSFLQAATLDFGDFDIVQAHVSVVAPFTAPLAAVAARSGVPTVVTVHSMWNGMGPVPGMAAAAAGLRSAPVSWTAVSRVAATQLATQLPGRTPVTVLPNAVDVLPRSRTPRAATRRLGPPDQHHAPGPAKAPGPAGADVPGPAGPGGRPPAPDDRR